MLFNFEKFFEKYTNYHSFVDLLNLCKEVSDYIYNNDITNSDYFESFKETKDGYEIIFNKNEKKNYLVNSKKETIKDDKGDEQVIDSVYEEVENLFNIIKNYEIQINIKQMDEKMKTFNDIIENSYLDYDKIVNIVKEEFNNSEAYSYFKDDSIFEEFEKSNYINSPSDEMEYAEQIINLIQNEKLNLKSFDDIIKEDSGLDYEEIFSLLENKGWDDLNDLAFINFESSSYFNSPSNEKEYISQMSSWLYGISKNEINKYRSVNESFEEDLKDKLSDKYSSLKREILSLLDKTLNSDTTKLQDFINSYIDPDSEEILEGFVEDADIFDIYLKHQSDIDQILLDNNYYDDPPGVESLYDYVIDGTFDAVVYCMEEMKDDLYGNE